MSQDKTQTQPKSGPIIEYATCPKRNPELRTNHILVSLSTNLFQLEISKKEMKLCIYSVSVNPEIARDNYSLFSKIQYILLE